MGSLNHGTSVGQGKSLHLQSFLPKVPKYMFACYLLQWTLQATRNSENATENKPLKAEIFKGNSHKKYKNTIIKTGYLPNTCSWKTRLKYLVVSNTYIRGRTLKHPGINTNSHEPKIRSQPLPAQKTHLAMENPAYWCHLQGNLFFWHCCSFSVEYSNGWVKHIHPFWVHLLDHHLSHVVFGVAFHCLSRRHKKLCLKRFEAKNMKFPKESLRKFYLKSSNSFRTTSQNRHIQ